MQRLHEKKDGLANMIEEQTNSAQSVNEKAHRMRIKCHCLSQRKNRRRKHESDCNHYRRSHHPDRIDGQKDD